MRAFSKTMILVGALIIGYLLRPMVEPTVDSMLNKLKGGA